MKKISIGEMVRRFAILRRELERGLITLTEYDDDMQFTVTRFTMIISRRRADPFVQTANSNALTPQMKQALNTVSAGDVVAIDDIYVKGGDGTNRKLEQGIAIRIQ